MQIILSTTRDQTNVQYRTCTETRCAYYANYFNPRSKFKPCNFNHVCDHFCPYYADSLTTHYKDLPALQSLQNSLRETKISDLSYLIIKSGKLMVWPIINWIILLFIQHKIMFVCYAASRTHIYKRFVKRSKDKPAFFFFFFFFFFGGGGGGQGNRMYQNRLSVKWGGGG